MAPVLLISALASQLIRSNTIPIRHIERPQYISQTKETYTLKGLITFYWTMGGMYHDGPVVDGYGNSCYGVHNYSDIVGPLTITVRDGNGNIIAIGKSSLGVHPDQHDISRCIFAFKVEVPQTQFYTIQLGNGQRGSLNFSLQDLIENDWIVQIKIN